MKKLIISLGLILFALYCHAQSFYVERATFGDKSQFVHYFTPENSQVYLLEDQLVIYLGGKMNQNIEYSIKEIHRRETKLIQEIMFDSPYGVVTYVFYKKMRYATLTGYLFKHIPMNLILHPTSDGY